MEQVVESQNLRTAYGRVKANAGAPGIDKMTVEELRGHLNEHWAGIKVRLLNGTYQPQPVRRVEIPKADGGKRKFLGFTFLWDRACRIRVAPKAIGRFRDHLKELFRMGRGRSLGRFVAETLNPVLRGWINYFRLAEVKAFAEELDEWLRRRLALILWRQWKRNWTRMQNLRKRGLAEERAAASAFNGRGPWWNAGASHMNEAYPKRYFDHLGLVSLLNEVRRQRVNAT